MLTLGCLRCIRTPNCICIRFQTYFAEQQRHAAALAALEHALPPDSGSEDALDEWSGESDYGYEEDAADGILRYLIM
jgi:hypothetical protein